MVILSRRMTQQRGSTMNQQFFTILLVALFLLILGCQDQLTESDVQRIREQGTTGPRGERGPQGPPGEPGSIELTDADLRTISAWVQDDLSRQATTPQRRCQQ